MDENNSIESWNPLNYTQNLCVVSNARNPINGITDESFPLSQQIAQQLSQLNVNANDGRDGRDSAFDSNQTLSLNKIGSNNVLIGDNPNVKTNIVSDANANNCGDIPVNKYQFNGMTGSQSVYKITSKLFIPTHEVMFPTNYANIKSYPQQFQSMTTTPSREMSQQMGQQLTHQLMPIIDQSLQDTSHQNSRHLRSIRARNSTHNSMNNSMESMNKLNYYLERCYEQYKHMEKERRKIELDLSQVFSGQKISSANNIPIQRVPQNATKIDRLITDMSREHAKVITIIAKMEQLRGDYELREWIHNSVERWLEMIRKLQMKRKDEMLANTGNFSNAGLLTDSFVGQLSDLVKELTASARAVRTSLWCAYVCTLYEKRFS